MENNLILTHICSPQDTLTPTFTLPLTAEQRVRSHQRITLDDGMIIHFRLKRGTVLKEGDILGDEKEEIIVKIEAKSEEVITVTASNYLQLMKAVYHLANRHIPLEINLDYLKLKPDSVLENMLTQLGLKITPETKPLIFIPKKMHNF